MALVFPATADRIALASKFLQVRGMGMEYLKYLMDGVRGKQVWFQVLRLFDDADKINVECFRCRV